MKDFLKFFYHFVGFFNFFIEICRRNNQLLFTIYFLLYYYENYECIGRPKEALPK